MSFFCSKPFDDPSTHLQTLKPCAIWSSVILWPYFFSPPHSLCSFHMNFLEYANCLLPQGLCICYICFWNSLPPDIPRLAPWPHLHPCSNITFSVRPGLTTFYLFFCFEHILNYNPISITLFFPVLFFHSIIYHHLIHHTYLLSISPRWVYKFQELFCSLLCP